MKEGKYEKVKGRRRGNEVKRGEEKEQKKGNVYVLLSMYMFKFNSLVHV